jgi:hypothetical protein
MHGHPGGSINQTLANIVGGVNIGGAAPAVLVAAAPPPTGGSDSGIGSGSTATPPTAGAAPSSVVLPLAASASPRSYDFAAALRGVQVIYLIYNRYIHFFLKYRV